MIRPPRPRALIRYRPFLAYLRPARRPRFHPLIPIALAYAVYLLSFSHHDALYFWLYDPHLGELAPRIVDAELTILWLLVIGSEIVIFALLARLLHRRKALSLFTSPGARFWRGTALGALSALIFFGAPALLDLLIHGPGEGLEVQPLIAGAALYMPLLALAVIFQASSEEVMFRGYLLQQIAARWPNPIAWAVLPSLGFGLMHIDPYMPATDNLFYIASTLIFGLTASYATWRTGALGLAIGMHVTGNWMAFLWIGEAGDPGSSLALYLAPPAYDLSLLAWELGYFGFLILLLESPASPARRWLGLTPLRLRRSPFPNRGAGRISP
ncbi:MAG: CPBP family intramembrane metalloprotease [Neomegalonema sp.]|nr:CPBP family intramembrane metalloprotease [Neomegalonema sp.]